jgi:hypothetical protein
MTKNTTHKYCRYCKPNILGRVRMVSIGHSKYEEFPPFFLTVRRWVRAR